MPTGVPDSAIGDQGAVSGWLAGRQAHAPQVISGCRVLLRGSLDAFIIRRVIRLHLNQVRFCYEQELGKEPDLAGRVTLEIVIAKTGKVESVGLAGSTLGNSRVEACVTEAVKSWEFPAVRDGGVVVVTYPFVFEPALPHEPTPIPVEIE